MTTDIMCSPYLISSDTVTYDKVVQLSKVTIRPSWYGLGILSLPPPPPCQSVPGFPSNCDHLESWDTLTFVCEGRGREVGTGFHDDNHTGFYDDNPAMVTVTRHPHRMCRNVCQSSDYEIGLRTGY